MKKILLPLVAILAFSAAKAQTFKAATEYNDFIVELQNSIGYKIVELNNAIGAEVPSKVAVDDIMVKTHVVIDAAIVKLEKAEPFGKSFELKKAAVDLFKFYQSIFKVEYPKLVNLVFAEEVTNEDAAALSKMLEDVTEREKGFDNAFQSAQKAFAEKYDFVLTKNEVQEQLDKE